MTNYFENPLDSNSVSHQDAKAEFEYWNELFVSEKLDDLKRWKFYRNPFLSTEDYAYDVLSDEEKRAILN